MALRDKAISAQLSQKHLAIIWGCQSSGANALADALALAQHGLRVPEKNSFMSPNSQGLAWQAPRHLRRQVLTQSASHIVMTPLVDSHLACQHLEELTDARGIWWVRHVLHAINQDIKRFPQTAGLANLTPILDNCTEDWRNQGIDSGTRELLHQLYHPQLPQADLAALFWYARNRLYFTQQLYLSPQVRCIFEAQALKAPENTAKQIQQHVDWARSPKLAHWCPVKVTHGIHHPWIKHLCAHLYKQLAMAQANRNALRVTHHPHQAVKQEAARITLARLKHRQAAVSQECAAKNDATHNSTPSITATPARERMPMSTPSPIDVYI
jgi:hypothetical protein